MSLFYESLNPSPYKLSQHVEKAKANAAITLENMLASLTEADVAACLGVPSNVPGIAERIERIRQRLVGRRLAPRATENTYRDEAARLMPYKGEENRRRLRDVIVEELLMRPLAEDEHGFALGAFGSVPPQRWAQPHTPTMGHATICIGGPGSGKSTVIRKSVTDGYYYVSADFVKRKLPEFSTKGASVVHEESVVVAEGMFTRYLIEHGFSFVIEKLGTHASDIRELGLALKNKGYRVCLELVYVPVQKCLVRVVDRTIQVGREMDLSIVSNNAAGPILAYDTLLRERIFEEYRAYDNDVEFGQLPLKISA